MSAPAWLDLLLLVLVVSAAIIDLAIRKIPNLLLLGGWLGALGLYCSATAPGAAIGTALGGALIGFALFLPLYVLRGMAAGDVKLMATVGLFLGPAETLYACILTWCLGGVMALVIILFTGRWSAAYANMRELLLPLLLRLGPPAPGTVPARQSVGSMPYGLAIALSTLWLLAQRHHP
ncbi:MAG: type leader peptidase family protein [Massilia sp.]|nr:type leader peptidase family protein [Massilia sp.]MDB5792784.1 type leader peptidase family protein [Massilia sp.]